MVDQRSTLEKLLLDLLCPNISPEMALLSLSSPCLAPEAFTSSDSEPILIFLGYMRFIMTRQPDGTVDGIWELILRKTIRHSRYITGIVGDIIRLTATYSQTKFTWVDPEMAIQIKIWLHKALSTPKKCPNPYLSLELFRLLTMVDMKINSKYLPGTFINAICEINPHCFYTSGDVDGMLFNITNLNRISTRLYCDLMVIISSDDHKNFNGARFISNVMQMIVVFAVITDSKNVNGINSDLSYCCDVLNTFLREFKHLVSRPLVRPYVVEAVRELTAVVVKSKKKDAVEDLKRIHSRNGIVADLDLCSKTYDLPKLLLLRQIHGPRQVRQHSLLLRNLYPLYKKTHVIKEKKLIQGWYDGDSL